MKRKPLITWLPFRLAALVVVLNAAWPQRAVAADIYWDNTGGTANDWAGVNNWSTVVGGGTSPAAIPGTGDVARFSATNLTAAQTVNLNAARSVQGIAFSTTFTHTLLGGSAAQTLTLGTAGISKTGTGAVTIGSTTAAQNVNIALGANQTWDNSAAGELIALNVISGGFNLGLSGTSVFRFAGANTYTGTTTIGAGTTLIAQANAALGTTAGGTTISSGGTLNLGGTLAANGLNLGGEAISVSGTGVGGAGAIINTGTAGQQNAIQGAVTMTGDTTFGGNQRWDIRNGTLNGGGFNLTKIGTNSIFLSGNTQIGTAMNSLTVRQGEYVFETGALASAAKITNGITLAPTTAVQAAFRSWGNEVDHSANVAMNSSFAGSSTRLDVENGRTIHSGTITATGGSNSLVSRANATMVINGVLAGGGNLSKDDAGLLVINNAANTQSGTFTVNGGLLGGSGTLASSTVTVNSGVVLTPGDSLASAGTLSVTNTLDLNGTTSAVFNLGTTSDNITAGTLNQDGTTNIFVTKGAGFTPGTFPLFNYTTLSGSNGAAGFSLASSHVDGSLVNSGSSINLVLNSLNPLKWTGESNGLWNSGSVTNPTLSNFGWAADPDGSVEYVNFDNVLFDDTNTGTTSIRVTSTITPASIEFNNSTLNYTVDSLAPSIAGGNIAGTTGIVKNGTATATLLGANTFTGDITVNEGTLQLGNDSRVATLTGGNSTSLQGTGPAIKVAAGATLGIAVGNDTAVTYSNNISGAGNIVLNAGEQNFYFNYRADRGNVNLYGDNSAFTGTITIQDGNRATINAANNISGASAVVIEDGGGLLVNGALTSATPLSIAGKGWAETAGMLGAVRLSGGATLSGPVTLTGDSRITAYNSSGTISGVIGGAYNLDLGFNHTSTTSGTLTLSNPASTYSGDTAIIRMNINADTMANAGSVSSLGRGDGISLNASTLNITGAGAMTTDRDVTLGNLGIGASTIGVTNPATTVTFTGAVDNVQPMGGSNGAVRQGLNFLQTATAGTGGTVVLDTATPIITSGTTVHRQNLTLAGDTSFTVGQASLNSANATNAGSFNLGNSVAGDAGNATLNIQDNASLTVYGEFDIGNQGVAGTYTVNQSGTSTVNALRGGTSGTGTNVINRGMRIGHWGTENSIYNLTGGSLNVPNGDLWVGYDGNATFNQAAGTTVNALGIRMVNNAVAANVNEYNLNGGTLNVGSAGLAKGGAGADVPQFNLNGGTYRATADHAISANIAINVLNGGGTIDTNGFNVTSGSRLIASGTGTFTKAGAGELVLPGGNNDYVGATNITGGTLTLNGATSLITASSLTTVGNRATLAGTGGVTAAGGVSVSAGGTLSPGMTAGAGNGTLTVSTATMSAGSAVDITPAASGGDLLAVTNGLTGTTTFNVLPVGATPLAAGTYTLATAGNTTGLTAATGAFPHLADGTAAPALTINPGSVTVTLSAAADPMRWTGAGGAVWDSTTANQFNGVSGNNNGVAFNQGDIAIFDDSSSVGTIAVQGAGVRPADVSFNNSTAAYILTGGAITGGTSLTKAGTATTILANNNSYAGTTTISAGTLQVGNGGTTGSLGLGATTNNGTLAFNRSDSAGQYNGVISGTGSVRSDGTGTTTLTGTNTYSGGTTISKGTMVGNAGSFGTGTITLNDASTGAENTALLIVPFNNNAAVTVTNNIVVSSHGTGTATIGGAEDSLVGAGTAFSGTLTLDHPTRLLGEFDRTTFTNVISGNVGTLTIARSPGLEDFESGRVVLEKDNTFVGNVVVEPFTVLQLNDISNAPANTAKNQIPDTSSVTLGNNSVLTLANSGTVRDDETIGDLISSSTTSRVRALNAASLVYGTANNATFNGIVDGGNTFDLIKQGTGTQTFGGTFDNGGGRMIVNAGTVVLAKNSSNTVHAIGGLLTVNTGGTVRLGGTYTAFRDESSNRDSPTQNLPDAPANFVDQIYNNVDVTLNTGGTLDLGGKSEMFDALTGGGTVTNSGTDTSTLYLGAADADAVSFTGVIQDGTGAVALNKGGSGNMTFAGTNTYTGRTEINRGTFTMTNIAALGSSSTGTFITGNRENAGASSQLVINVATASDPSAPNILAEALTLTSELSNDLRTNVQNNAESTRLTGLITLQGDGTNQINANQGAGDQFQINGGISGTGTGLVFLRGTGELAVNSVMNAPNVALFKTDAGTLIMNATGHDYREANFVHGTVRTDVVNALDTGAIVRMGQNGNDNTLNLNGNNQQIAGLFSNPGIDARARTVTSAAPATLTISNAANGQAYLYTGNITGAITLEKSGAGAQVLGTPASGSNTYTGNTVINNGALRLANSNVLPDGASAGHVIAGTGADTAHLDLNGNSETINGLHGNSKGLVTSNGAGTATLTVRGSAAPATSATFAGTLADSTDGGAGKLNLVKDGADTQILAGVSTYTGTTTVNAGVLHLASTADISSSSLTTVKSGATLSGTGTVGDILLEDGFALSPGNSPGILSTGSVTTTGGTLGTGVVIEIGGLNAGTDHDQIQTTGGINLNGGVLSVSLINSFTPTSGDVFHIWLNDGTDLIAGTPGTFSGLSEGGMISEPVTGGFFTISYQGNGDAGSVGNDISLTYVPEPGTGILLLLAGSGFLRRRRRA